MSDNTCSDVDRVALLTAIYQTERADNASIFTNTLAILSFAVTYVATILGLVSAADSVDGVLLAFAPLPACALVAYHQVMVGMNGVRAAAAQRIEKTMLDLLGDAALRSPAAVNPRWWQRITTPKPLPAGDPTFGVGLGEQLLDPRQASFVRVLGAGLPYAFLFASTLGFTVFLLDTAAENGAGPLAMVTGIGLSAVLLLATVLNMALNGRRPEVTPLTT